MNNEPHNPVGNQLGAGVTEAQVIGAVQKSGYPLQTVVASTLRSKFFVQEEWCYVDRDTKELRTIDIRARRMLYDHETIEPRVRPQVELLIECKQSQQPHIFFLSPDKPILLDSPKIAGLHQENIKITTDDDLSTWNFHISSALGLNIDNFHQTPSYCHSFSKCVRKGNEIELSGTEAYTGLVLPLIKGVQHLFESERPPKTAWYFDGRLVLPVGVLDSPMVAASIENGETILTLVPWIRIIRHEYLEGANKFERNNMWPIDVVHKDFFPTYLGQHAIPFAERFSQLVLRHPDEVATGLGFISGMGNDSWKDIEGRLRPRPVSVRVNRASLFFKNLVHLITRRKLKR
jgi:hypothetical protein